MKCTFVETTSAYKTLVLVCKTLLSFALLLFAQNSYSQMDSDFSGGGAIRVGDSTTTCDVNATGAIRFDDSAADTLDYCDGSNWLSILTSSIGGGIVNNGNSLSTPMVIGTNDSNSLSFETNGSTHMTIDTSGNVGIGTTTPTSALQVSGTLPTKLIIEDSTSTGYKTVLNLRRENSSGVGGDTMGSHLNFEFEGGTEGSTIYGARFSNRRQGDFELFVNDGGTLEQKLAVNADNFSIMNSNVGIGTDGPAVELDVHTGSINAAQICDEDNANCLDLSAGAAGATDLDGLSDVITDYTYNNIYVGNGVGVNATTGAHDNTGLGYGALSSLTTGDRVTAIGTDAAKLNDAGIDITAIGYRALEKNTGNNNTAVGSGAAIDLTTGWGNTVMGYNAFGGGANGSVNTVIGQDALSVASTPDFNVAIGDSALKNLRGDHNVAVGNDAGNGAFNYAYNNVFIGYQSGSNRTTADNNIMIGYRAGDLTTDGDNNIIIGYDVDASSATASNELNIGNAIYGNLSSGYVGIGTTIPDTTLAVEGAIRSAASVINATATVDFSTGNLQHTTSSCGAFNLHNMKDGGSYTFAVQGATSATCSFLAYSDAGTTSLTVHMPTDHGATVASKHTLYTILVMGTHAYVAWMPGL